MNSIAQLLNNQDNKKTITPKRKIHNFKTLKTQRPSNLPKNINLNIKGKTTKYLDTKNSKLISAKEYLKIKFNFKNINLNINQYSANPSLQIKGLLNGINYKKINEDKKEKNNNHNNNLYLNTENKKKLDFKDYKTYKEILNNKNKKKEILEENSIRLNTEIIQNKNKNYLENKKEINYIINNTIDSIKNNNGYISDIKKIVLGNKISRRKNDINLNDFRERRKNNDIKRIKSTNFSYNNTISINPTFNNNNIRKNIFKKNSLGQKLLNRLQILTNKNNNTELIYGSNHFNFSNRKSTYESEICDNNVKTDPSSEFFPKYNHRENHFYHIKINTNTTATSTINTNPTNNVNNTIQSNKFHRGIYPKRLNYNHQATYFGYLNSIKKLPNYNIIKNNNLIKNKLHNDIFKNSNINKERRIFFPKNNETTITSKKNPFVTIRNTVINFNMIDPGLIGQPSYNKKTLDRKKYNLNGPYNTQNQIHSNKKNLKELSEMYAQKTFNNSINKIQNLNNCTFRPLLKNKINITSNHCNNHSLSINNNNKTSINKDLLYSANRRLKTQTIPIDNKNSAISSFTKLVNKMKNKQLYSKRHSNSVEKNHNIFKSMKLNDYYLKNVKNKNYTLPALIIKTKKFFNPKTKGFLIQPKMLNLNNTLQSSNITENNRQYYLKGINNLKS